MTPKQDIYELIDSYLEGTMSVPEQANFESMIQGDPELAKEVQAMKLANAVVADYGLVQLRGKLDKIHEEHHGGSTSGGGKAWWIIGAVTLFVSVTGVITYQYNKAPKPVVEKKQEVEAVPNKNIEKESGPQLTVSPEVNTGKAPAVSPESKPAAKPAKNVDCSTVYITGDVRITETCYGSDQGKIKVDQKTLQGGKAPYRYSLDNKTYQKDNVFLNLDAGNYTIYVQDKNSCISKLTEVEVKSRTCKGDEAFNPEQEQWLVPVDKNLPGKLVIFNTKGNVVYKSDFEVGEKVNWNGKSGNGSELPAGNYGFDISYSNGTSRGGTVTVLK